MEKNKKNDARYDVIERYCPKCGENVIMRRTYGLKTELKCMNYENCTHSKDDFCG